MAHTTLRRVPSDELAESGGSAFWNLELLLTAGLYGVWAGSHIQADVLFVQLPWVLLVAFQGFAPSGSDVSRYLRSGVLMAWAAVVVVLVVVVAVAVFFNEPNPRGAPQPRMSEMFSDAVDVRLILASSLRSGDIDALATHANALSKRWSTDDPVDYPAARRAAAKSTERLAGVVSSAAADGVLDVLDRDAIVTEADMFAALAASWRDPAVVSFVTAGPSTSDVVQVRPTAVPLEAAGASPSSRLYATLSSLGVDVAALTDRLRSSGAPSLGVEDLPELPPPGSSPHIPVPTIDNKD